MGFSFSQRGKVGGQVRSIATEQIEASLADISAAGNFDDTVHELRRRCKKIRGLLRLVRPHFAGFEVENAAFRDAADALSAARDAAVMLDTFEAVLKDDAARSLPVETGNRLRRALEGNVQRILHEQDRAGLLDAFSEAMSAARLRVAHWRFGASGFALIEPGLRDIYARMRNRLRTAEKGGDDNAFHDWRKDTKSHWFHVSLLKGCAPDRLGARRDQLDTLGEYLGDHHNLAVLTRGLKTLTGALDPVLSQAIVDRKDALAGKAFALGRQLTVESPGALVARFEQFWKLLPKDD